MKRLLTILAISFLWLAQAQAIEQFSPDLVKFAGGSNLSANTLALDGGTDYNVLTLTSAPSAAIGDASLMSITVNSSDMGIYDSALHIKTDDAGAYAIRVSNLSGSDRFYVLGSGRLYAYDHIYADSSIYLLGGGSILTTSNGDVTIAPAGSGEVVISGATYSEHCEIYISSAAGTALTEAGGHTKMLGTTTEGQSRPGGCLSHVASNRVSNSCNGHTYKVSVAYSMSASAGTPVDSVCGIYFYDDSGASGSVLTKSEIYRRIGSPSIYGAAYLQSTIQMDADDYVEVHCKCIGGGCAATMQLDTMNITVEQK